MTEHEKLKEICDLIGYNLEYSLTSLDIDEDEYLIQWKYFIEEWFYNDKWVPNIIDVREIIFTQEFMDRLYKYYSIKLNWPMWMSLFSESLLFHLNDPVSYLYNLLWLWIEKKL